MYLLIGSQGLQPGPPQPGYAHEPQDAGPVSIVGSFGSSLSINSTSIVSIISITKFIVMFIIVFMFSSSSNSSSSSSAISSIIISSSSSSSSSSVIIVIISSSMIVVISITHVTIIVIIVNMKMQDLNQTGASIIRYMYGNAKNSIITIIHNTNHVIIMIITIINMYKMYNY